MKKHILQFLLLATSTVLNSQSVVETHTFFSSALGVEKSYLIYLPDGYGSDTSIRYPCVYFLRLHENEWFNPLWRADGKTLKNVADDLIASGEIGKMILIGPSTGGDDPNFTDFCIINMLRPDLADDQGVGTGAFEDYFFQDLIPHIDSTYRTIPEWCARGVDGFSLGGFASTLFALKHPGVFSSVGSYDGTLMWYNLDNTFTPGPWDDSWFYIADAMLAGPMFNSPLDTAYMLAHSAPNILVGADPAKLDSIQQISFHISTAASIDSSNRLVNEQFIDSLEAKGIINTFNNSVLAPNAVHTYDWADEHAKLTLPKHWETFSTFSCESLTETDNPPKPSQSIVLHQNSPNPVSTSTLIAFETPESCRVSIDIFDSFGMRIRRLLSGDYSPGRYEFQVDMADLPNGLYLYRMESDKQIQTKKLLVLRSK